MVLLRAAICSASMMAIRFMPGPFCTGLPRVMPPHSFWSSTGSAESMGARQRYGLLFEPPLSTTPVEDTGSHGPKESGPIGNSPGQAAYRRCGVGGQATALGVCRRHLIPSLDDVETPPCPGTLLSNAWTNGEYDTLADFYASRAISITEDLLPAHLWAIKGSAALATDANRVFDGKVYNDWVQLSLSDSMSGPAYFYCGADWVTTNGALTAGTVTGFYSGIQNNSMNTAVTDISFTGFSISAAKLHQVMTNDIIGPSFKLVAKMFAHADTITLSDFADGMQGWGGDDTMRGFGGADTLQGDAGADQLFGGSGADRLIGGLDGDVLTGGISAHGGDVFVFDKTSGADRISDFQDGIDLIEITSGAVRFDQLTVQDQGADVLVSFGTSSVLIQHIEPGALTEADFLFT
ncbi:MAG: hypothetical protein H7245_20190 [Candidatus Saccharibacteria bacterium]|nr:hypothetical protein [Pseudorhodobacter sp.]